MMQPLPLPYCGAPPHPGELLARFNFDPVLIAALLGCALLHGLLARGRRQRQLALSGWLVAAAAFISPLCALSVSLFAARVGQHMILLLLAAPLIAYAWPKSARESSRDARVWSLWASAAAFMVTLWFWHMPRPYDATFASSAVYWAMHVTLFGSGILLWRELLHHDSSRTVDVLAAGIVSSMQMSLLGAVLTFAARPLFFAHLSTTQAWGFSPLQDQQLGGVLMWVPGMLLFLWVSLRSVRQLWSAVAELKST